MLIKAIPVRHVFTLLCFLAMFNMFTLRVNISVAIVAMVKDDQLHQPESLQHSLGEVTYQESLSPAVSPNNFTNDINKINTSSSKLPIHTRGEFDWNPTTQGQVLASYFYGYIFSQIPAGVLSDKYGGKWPMGIALLASSVGTLLNPLFSRWNVVALILLRTFIGFCQGAGFPASNALVGRWAPKMERSRIFTIVTKGMSVGTAASLALSGILCDSDFFGGWPAAFYVFGALGCFWFVLWTLFAYSGPEDHPTISKEELDLIIGEQNRTQAQKQGTPWKSILSSPAVWALFFAHLGCMWVMFIFLIEMPTYLTNVLHFNLSENGVLSALPQLLSILSSLASSTAADKLRESGRLRITFIRKIFNSIGFFGTAACLFLVTFSGCGPLFIVVLLTAAIVILECSLAGYMSTFIDMSPEFSGVLFGISNTFVSLCGLLIPNVTAWILSDGQTIAGWNIIFQVSATLLIVSGLAYDVFCTSERQEWGKLSQQTPDGDSIEKCDDCSIKLSDKVQQNYNTIQLEEQTTN